MNTNDPYLTLDFHVYHSVSINGVEFGQLISQMRLHLKLIGNERRQRLEE